MSAADRDASVATDAEARRLARERFDRPVLLEAGAGTGKTRALVERLLAWTLDLGWEDSLSRLSAIATRAGRPRPDDLAVAADVLDGVVAITFTDAAAAEMATRLGAALAAIARRVAPDEGRETVERLGVEPASARAAPLATELGRARIQTIHAFCRALLAAYPFEAGLHPAFAVDADGEALERIATEVLTNRLVEGLASESPDWLALVGAGHDIERLFAALVAAIGGGVPAEALAADPFPPDRVAARLARARAAIAPLATALAAARPRLAANQRAHEVEPRLVEILAALGRAEPLAALASAAGAAAALLGAEGATIRKWSAGESIARIEKALPPELGAFAELAGAALPELEALAGADPEGLARLARVFAPLVAEVRERLRREGFVGFEDLLARAARLLAERRDLASSVRRGIRQLLVDEFQDTDRRQVALIESLAFDGEETARPGLFVVGDPKQSIYGWRRADLAVYDRFVEAAARRGALRGRLAVNFRSTPAILDEVERILAPAFTPEPGLQPPFEPLVASPAGVARGAASDGPAIEYWAAVSPALADTRAGEATRIEARSVAADLAARRAAEPTLPWSESALLARATGDLEVYLQALRERGIPFAVERDRSYWRRREVIDAAALLRAVIDPGDGLALVTFLRSPFVGVPDAALAPLWRESFPARVDALVGPQRQPLAELDEILARVARDLPRDVPGLDGIEGWEASAALAIEALAELRAAFGREPGERFVERLRSRLALEASAAARFLGRFGLANLERFFAELERALEASGDDPAAIARFLRRAVCEQRAAEEARPPAADADAVRVLTIHRAKGLQFRHVYLLQAHKGRGSNRGAPAFDAEHLADGTVAYSLLGLPTLDWSDVVARREVVAEREQVRLLYVAMTRAKDRLVVGGQLLAAGAAGSFLPRFAARIAASPAAALADGGAAALPRRDAHGALWRAPGLEPEGADATAPASAPSAAGGDLGDPARQEAALGLRRDQAAARAARPRLARASGSVVDPAFASADPAAAGDPARSVALALGSALHRALELAPLASQDARAWRAAARHEVAARAAGEPQVAPALTALDAALAALLASRLWKRLADLAPHVLARELPLLVAADPDAAEGPIDGVTGTLDLLYRDPGSGETVVADFKSDAVATEEEVAAKVEIYRPQLAVYGRAVALALAPSAPPRLELWLLAQDRIVVVPG
ncbi:MAG: UvrD-helicase domain-containing protein [Thermoanaerobaculia bacterium]